jgi:pSer/pThr/pTyr-binding forkhead associated (FHA) protein
MDIKAENFHLLAPPENKESEPACSPSRIDSSYPFLEMQEPDGKEYTIGLQDIFQQTPEQTRLTIGRSDDNDIVLPDPHKKVSRRHCTIEREGDRWWLVDEGSANGTFLRQQGGGSEVDVRAVDTILLQDRDVILILGKLTASQQPVFWQLTFRDPNVTDRVEGFQPPAEIEYHLSSQKLFQVSQQQRSQIKLSPQEQNLIHYMAQRSCDNNHQPTVCGYKDLIDAIWQEPFGRTPNEVNRLVWSVREKIERDSGEPRFLKTVRGQGYLLNIRIQ